MNNRLVSNSGGAAQLIAFAASLRDRPMAEPLHRRAKTCLIDGLGCGLFGSGQPWGRIVSEEMLAEGSRGPSSVYGQSRTTAASPAAFCNGTATHGFELDDVIATALIHPGAVIIPAVLAAAQAVDASGETLLKGVVIGYEAIGRVSEALGIEPSHRGFHKTSVAGPVAAAIAAGFVMGLTEAQLVAAVGLACSTSSGIKSFAAGSGGGMVKRMHAGWAAAAGVRMSQLAKRGFTGPSSALDGRLGLLEVFGGHPAQHAVLSEGLGDKWAINDVWVKVYPTCGLIQGVVQSMLALTSEAKPESDHVQKIVIGTSAFAAGNNSNKAPAETMEAQYSIPYCAALALLGDPSDPLEYGHGPIHDPARRSLAGRVELCVDDECQAAFPGHFASRVQLHLTDGVVKEAMVLDPHGSVADPCAEEEIVSKFKRLAALAPGSCDSRAIVEAIDALDRSTSTRDLGRLLRPAA